MHAPILTPRTQFGDIDRLTAAQPPEHRGLARDGVRLLVASESGISHALFRDLPRFLDSGDLLVVNNSATIAAELDALRRGLGAAVLHVAGELDDGTWAVELRSAPDAVEAILDAADGEVIDLADGVVLSLLEPYPKKGSSPSGWGARLWRARVEESSLQLALRHHGRPVAYGYLDQRYPLEDYQTIFGTNAGSAEMPSAGRPFTSDLVTRLVSSGVSITAITLHTGVSSQDAGESPQPERFEVSPSAARLVNAAKADGGRVIAVGTTVTRALETAAGPDGTVTASAGWTERVISPHEPVRVVDGLISGWHDPDASHLLLVESVAGADLTQQAYAAAVAEEYLWHEFGDSCLLLPRTSLTVVA